MSQRTSPDLCERINSAHQQGTSYPELAERAGACEVVEIEGASHTVGVSHPDQVADKILRALKEVE